MNQQHLMKFTILQMERERERSLRKLKKKHPVHFAANRLKRLIDWKTKFHLKRETEND